jgi:hypothetical protein
MDAGGRGEHSWRGREGVTEQPEQRERRDGLSAKGGSHQQSWRGCGCEPHRSSRLEKAHDVRSAAKPAAVRGQRGRFCEHFGL